MRAPKACFLALAITFAVGGCALNRTGVTALSENQQAYYQKLDETLAEGRFDLQQGLEVQLDANNKRRMNLNEWQHDLQRAEILLQVDADVTGNKRLLSLQLAQLNLQRVDALAVRDETSAEHVAAILTLYDGVQQAVHELQTSNKIIIDYLGSSDKEFVLRSLDIGGIVTAVAAIQSAREQLGGIEARSEEESVEDREQIQKSVERARDVLLRVFELSN